MSSFNLKLGKEYWINGKFNIPVDYDHLVTQTQNEVTLVLGNSEKTITSTFNRTYANPNGTGRVLGNKELKTWFQQNYQLGATIKVEIVSPTVLKLS